MHCVLFCLVNSLVSLQLGASSSIGCASSTHRNDARLDECVPRLDANLTTHLPAPEQHLQATAARSCTVSYTRTDRRGGRSEEKQTARCPSAVTGQQDVCTQVTRTYHVMEEAVVGQMEVEYHPLHFLRSMLVPKTSKDRVRLSPFR